MPSNRPTSCRLFQVPAAQKHIADSMLTLVAVITVAIMFLAGCQSGTPTAQRSSDANRLGETQLKSYTLETDDTLNIKFFYNSELNETVTVGRDGMISLQLIDAIQAAGKTPEQLEQAISEGYEGILRNPEVAVIVQKLAPRSFYIFGEVNDPGTYPHTLGMTVIKAVATANGFTYRARKDEVLLTRRDDASGTPVLADHSTPILPGDIIEVRERYY